MSEVIWQEGKTPLTKKGSATKFWVTARHKETGKLTVWPMVHLNAHVMPLHDDCYDPPECAVPRSPEEDGYCEEYEWTGWSSGECEHCECTWMFTEAYWEIIAYAPAPEPFGKEEE